MSIQVDWEIVHDDVPPDQPVPKPVPRPRRRLSRKWLISLALILVAVLGAAAFYVFSIYRQQLERVGREIRPIARLEVQAVATNDLRSFLALQDPDDPAWRALQEKRFGRLEREGLPEFGWKAMGIAPQLGGVTLEPGGARIDVIYQFSVTQPMPNGPATIKLSVPHYYEQTPSGWVRANGAVEYWGTWQHRSGNYFAMRYTRRDTDVLDGLVARMDEMLARVCGPLPCPPQPIFIEFGNSADSLSKLTDFSYGFDASSFILRLPSPQLYGVPTDARSREELYRAIGTRIVQALVTEASRGHPNLPYLFSRQLLQWELCKAGLAGPFITPEMTRTLTSSLRIGVWQPLSTLAFRSRASGPEPTNDELMMPSLALAFLEQYAGAGTVERLIPAMQFNVTLGEGIGAALKVDPRSLEPAWLEYLRKQAGLPTPRPAPPEGELALTCFVGGTGSFSILRIGADGSTIQTVEGQVLSIPQPAWSPDGKKLAYLRSGRVQVMDADTRQYKTVTADFPIGAFGWLPDGRLWVSRSSGTRRSSEVINPDADERIQIAGINHLWSPDGKRLAYLNYSPGAISPLSGQSNPSIWLAQADGSDAQRIALGYSLTWSPDSARLAFLNGVSGNTSGVLDGEIQVADVNSGAITTLVRAADLPAEFTGAGATWIGNLTWSPDGSMLAVAVNRTSGPTLFVLDAHTGVVRSRWTGTSARWVSLAWSADSRYVGFWIVVPSTRDVVGTVGALDVATGLAATLQGRDFDWSPDGRWLAVPQEQSGVLVVAPDLAAVRWLDAPGCLGVAWRPGTR